MTTHDDLPEGVRAHIKALLAGEPVAHRIIDDSSPDVIETIASTPEITWTVLARQPDRDAAMRLLEYRLQESFVCDATQTVAAEMELPELIRDAASDPGLEELAVRAITGLAWDEPRRAFALYQRYRANHAGLADVYSACEQVLLVAPLWAELERERPVPRPLARFLRMQWVASQQVLDQLIVHLRRDMTTRSSAYLDVLDAMAERYTTLLQYIEHLTERFVPAGAPSLGELEEDERRRLSTALGEIDAPMARGLRLSHLLLAVLTTGALLSLGGFDSAAMIAIAVLGATAAGYSAWAERGLYGRCVRQPLAAYLAESGMPTDCVVSWLLSNRKAVKKIKAFDVAIDADPALATMARLGRMARARSKLLTSS